MLIIKLHLPDNWVSFSRGVKDFRVFEMERILWKQSSVNILFPLQVLKLWKKGKEFLKSRAAWVELVSGKSYKQLSFLIPKMKFMWKLNFCPTGSNHSKSTVTVSLTVTEDQKTWTELLSSIRSELGKQYCTI